MKNLSNERISKNELLTNRLIPFPNEIIFEAWSQAEKFRQWWIPRSFPIAFVSCEMNVCTGGQYRLVLKAGPDEMAFFGKYLEVTPSSRIIWTKEESGPEASTVTKVTFESHEGGTLVTVIDSYATREALDEAIAAGSCGAMSEQLAQLEQFLHRNHGSN